MANFLQRLFGRVDAAEAEAAAPAPTAKEDRDQRGMVAYSPDRSDYGYSTSGAGLSPAKVASALSRAESGDPGPISEILEQILERDWQMASVVNTRRLGVLGLRRQVSDTEKPEIAEAVRSMLDGLGWGGVVDGALDFGGLLSTLLGAIVHPLAGCEIVWSGEGGRDSVAAILSRPVKRFRYNTGQMPTSVPLGALHLVTQSDPTGQPLRPAKWIIHRSQNGNTMPHRAGLARPLLWAWLFKTMTFRDWVTFLEVYGQPLRIGRFGPAATSADKQALRQALASLGTDAAAILSDATRIEFQEANRGDSGAAYADFVDYIDRQVARIVLGHEGSSSSTSGRLGGESEAAAVRQDILEADAAALADTVTRYLIAPFVRLNFGPDAEIPRLTLVSEESEDLDRLAERVKTLSVDVGLRIPAAWAYDRFGIPAPEDGDPVLEAPPTGGPPGGFGLRSQAPACDCGSGGRVFSVDLAEDADGALAERQEQELVELASERARPLHERTARPFVGSVESAGSYGEALSALDFVDVDPSDLADFLARVQVSSSVIGGAQIAAEAGLGEAAEAVRIWQPEQAIAWLESRTVIDRGAFEALSAAQRNRAFSLAAHEAQTAKEAVRSALVRAMQDGTPFAQFQRAYREIARSAEFLPTSPWHLETVYRTNIGRSLAVGRHQQMTHPAVLALRPFWQYRTAGDGSVRDAHRALNGLVYPADHPFWGVYGPPNGFNCRCYTVTLSQRQVDRRGLEVGSSVPSDLPRPDPGFDVAPWVDPGSTEGLDG